MRILLVEDDSQISEFLKTSLESQGFAVDAANDGERGSFLARTNDYDLILLDYILPKKTGRQVCFEVREKDKKTPIIMLTVKSEAENVVDLLNLGADDYIAKPFSFEEVLARIKAVLRRPRESEPQAMAIGDLVLDVENNAVKRGGKEIYLTCKEFALLEYLLKNKGKIVSRGKILEHVWDLSADPFSNTIEVHILNLRKKIDKGFRQKLIHTMPGRGYKIDTQK